MQIPRARTATKQISFKTLLLAAVFCGLTSPSLASGESKKSLEPIPPFALGAIQQSTYYEEFLVHLLNPVRQYLYQGGLDKESVQKQAQDQTVKKRANQVESILRYDRDGDGKVSFAELEAQDQNNSATYPHGMSRQNRQLEQMKTFDANGDSIIDYNEMRVLRDDNSSRMLSQFQHYFDLPAAKDGKLTYNELSTWAKIIFAQVDVNKDGALSVEEKTAFMPDVGSRRAADYAPKLKIDVVKAQELHAVGVYEGYSGERGKPQAAEVLVKLDRPGKEVVLVLTSYEPVRWKLDVTKGTLLKKVYLRPQRQKPESEVLVNGKPFVFEAAPLEMVYQAEGNRFRKFLSEVTQASGRERIDSFNGKYQAPNEGFVIDAVSKSTDLQVNRLKPVSAEGLPKLTLRQNIHGAPGEYDLTGKRVNTLNSQLVKATYILEEGAYYGIGNNGVVKYDKDGKKQEEFSAPLDVPRFSHANAITFDSKEKRIVISSFGGEGYLYSFGLKDKDWKAVSLNNTDVQDIDYDAKEDIFVGIDWYGAKSLILIGRDGAVKGRKPLDHSKMPGLSDTYDPGNGPIGLTLDIFPEYYVFTTAGGHMGGFGRGIQSRIYLMDRKDDSVKLTFASPEKITPDVSRVIVD